MRGQSRRIPATVLLESLKNSGKTKGFRRLTMYCKPGPRMCAWSMAWHLCLDTSGCVAKTVTGKWIPRIRDELPNWTLHFGMPFRMLYSMFNLQYISCKTIALAMLYIYGNQTAGLYGTTVTPAEFAPGAPGRTWKIVWDHCNLSVVRSWEPSSPGRAWKTLWDHCNLSVVRSWDPWPGLEDCMGQL